MNVMDSTTPATGSYKRVEIWCQDAEDHDLWRHESGLLVNGAALAEREFFYSVVRIGVTDPGCGSERNLPTLGA